MIFVGQAALRRAVTEFIAHYHRERNHQGLRNRLIQSEPGSLATGASVCRRERLGGMLSFYYLSDRVTVGRDFGHYGVSLSA